MCLADKKKTVSWQDDGDAVTGGNGEKKTERVEQRSGQDNDDANITKHVTPSKIQEVNIK